MNSRSDFLQLSALRLEAFDWSLDAESLKFFVLAAVIGLSETMSSKMVSRSDKELMFTSVKRIMASQKL